MTTPKITQRYCPFEEVQYTEINYSKVINGILVEVILIDEYVHHSISVKLNNACDFDSSAPKVAITRWVLSIFKEIKPQYSKLTCDAYDEDGKGRYRRNMYKKLGFKFSPYTGGMVLE